MFVEPQTIVVVLSIWCNGKLLLGKKKKDTTHISGQWHIPGGKLQPGECILKGLQREIMEETGLSLYTGDFKFLCGTTYTDKINLWFRYDLNHTVNLTAGSDLVELGWFNNPDEVMGVGCTYPAIATQH